MMSHSGGAENGRNGLTCCAFTCSSVNAHPPWGPTPADWLSQATWAGHDSQPCSGSHGSEPGSGPLASPGMHVSDHAQNPQPASATQS